MASSCIRGGSDWILQKVSSPKGSSSPGPGCPGQWGSPHPWRGSNTVWMWPLGTWFSRPGGVGVTVGLGDLRGLSHPGWFCDLERVGSGCAVRFPRPLPWEPARSWRAVGLKPGSLGRGWMFLALPFLERKVLEGGRRQISWLPWLLFASREDFSCWALSQRLLQHLPSAGRLPGCCR